MWESAGASIVSPPSNEIYNAFQSGVVNGTDTSLGTFASMRLYEVTDCLTAPGEQRAVVHVRAGAHVEEDASTASTRSSSRP